MTEVVLAVASLTDRGLSRPVNEDSLFAAAPIFVVADGMGGYEAGDLASAAVVDAFRGLEGDGYGDLAGVRRSLVQASDAVAAVAGRTRRGAGSTVTGAMLVEHGGVPYWLVFNVGDSRVYRHAGSDLVQLTVDHSLGQELIELGELRREDLATFVDRNVITRAIGAADSTADSWLVPVIDGDRLLLCSDGLHSELTDETIRATLTLSGRPQQAADTLVELAKEAGGRDNITVIVVDVVSGGGALEGDDTGTTAARAVPGGDIDEDTVPVRP